MRLWSVTSVAGLGLVRRLPNPPSWRDCLRRWVSTTRRWFLGPCFGPAAGRTLVGLGSRHFGCENDQASDPRSPGANARFQVHASFGGQLADAKQHVLLAPVGGKRKKAAQLLAGQIDRLRTGEDRLDDVRREMGK